MFPQHLNCVLYPLNAYAPADEMSIELKIVPPEVLSLRCLSDCVFVLYALHFYQGVPESGFSCIAINLMDFSI